MPRPAKIDKPRRLELQIPSSVFSQVEQELYSDLEGRVPHWAYSNLITALFKEWLTSRGRELS